MAGRKKTREKLEQLCKEQGIPPPKRGEPLTPMLEAARLFAKAEQDNAELRRIKNRDAMRLRRAKQKELEMGERKEERQSKNLLDEHSRVRAGLKPRNNKRNLCTVREEIALVDAGLTPKEAKEKVSKKVTIKKATGRKATKGTTSKGATTQTPQTTQQPITTTSSPNDVVTITPNDIKRVLREILLSPREAGASRISAASKLLEMDGTTAQYQKALLEVRLTSYAPNQYEQDVARHKARLIEQVSLDGSKGA